MFRGRNNKKIIVDGELNLTLSKICAIMGVKVPKRFKNIADKVNNDLVMNTKIVKNGSIYFMMFEDVNVRKNLQRAVNKGAEVIFIGRDILEKGKVKEKDFPVIVLENRMEQVGKLYSTIRKSYKAKTVAITGTVGKTTTNQLLTQLVKSAKKTVSSTGNLNSYMATARHIVKKLECDKEVFIQECGAGSPMSVEKAGRMLAPDVFILLNVEAHHLNKYGTHEALFKDKSSIDLFMEDNGIVITNYDDEMIANHEFKHKVVSFGITTEREVDYRAINIEERNEILAFDVIHDNKMEHIEINILGKHNVYNALAAYVGAVTLGVDIEEIKAQFAKYRPVGIRQNYVNIGGYKLYVDCYNAAIASIMADVEILNKFTIDEGCRKIAVLGGENGLGEAIKEKNYELGQRLKQFDIDEFICYGPDTEDMDELNYKGDGKSVYQGLKDAGVENAKYFGDDKELAEYIKKTVNVGDMILFKCIIWLDMPIIIDNVFGTSFSYYHDDYKSKFGKVKDNKYSANAIPQFGGVNIISSSSNDEILNVPSKISCLPVYRVTKNLFAKNTKIKVVNFGEYILNIGEKAFYMCEALKEVNIPSNVKVIEKSAFEGCAELERVNLEEGLTHISEGTFKKCSKIQSIEIPVSVNYIGEDAFEGCDNLVIKCETGSYAHKYAMNHGISVEIK